MSTTNQILTLTMNPAVDKSAAVDQVVADRKLRCGLPHFEPGGGGINVCRAIKRLGGEATAHLPAGGPAGELLESLLEAESLRFHIIPIEKWTRQNQTILEETTGRQFRFGMPGPELSTDEWETCLQSISHADPKPEFIVASGSLPPGVPDNFYTRVAAEALKLGSSLILDTSGAALRHGLDNEIFLLKVNLRELGELANKNVDDETDQELAARSVVDKKAARHVVVSLGPAGALLASANGCIRITSPVVPVRSVVGAGDSMVAGIVQALAEGLPTEEAARRGVAAGAAAVMTPGTELCRKEDADRILPRVRII